LEVTGSEIDSDTTTSEGDSDSHSFRRLQTGFEVSNSFLTSIASDTFIGSEPLFWFSYVSVLIS
jgi:hypothetical protein